MIHTLLSSGSSTGNQLSIFKKGVITGMTPEDLVKTGAQEAMRPFAELIEKLLGPAAEGIGAGLGAMVGPWAVKRQIRFWHRTQEMIAKAGFEPSVVAPKLLVPIVQN